MRKVYFGLRSRLLGLLLVVVSLVIIILTLLMYLNQRRMLSEEKTVKAETLVRILSGPAEYYLDQNSKTAQNERKNKFDTISREAANFKAYNDDIVKIVLANENGAVMFSTDQLDFYGRAPLPYIKETLPRTEEKLVTADFMEKDRGGKPVKSHRAIAYPIFLKSGRVVEILDDFNKNYNAFRAADKRERARIYTSLAKKYSAELGGERDQAQAAREKPQKNQTADVRAGDIDFLFLRLFSDIMSVRAQKIRPAERWLWQEAWLLQAKMKKLRAYENDLPKEAYEIDEQIQKNFRDMAARIGEIKRLGALAIVFDVEKLKKDLDRDIAGAVKIALIMIGVAVVTFAIVLHFMIVNLKRLERWAVTVSEGNIDTRIEIPTNDEIGRLGDIFNLMIREIAKKYHLEKYVSRSTRSLIETKKDGTSMELGGTARRDLAFMFSDVRGFTSYSEQNDPQAVIELLNYYLELQSNIVKSTGGDIDDYVGDQIMAHWGGATRADRAIESAKKIILAVREANAKRRAEGLPVFEVGIGIHGGEVVVGNVGSQFRMDFACVGDAVNLTSRLCSAALPGQIIISKELFAAAKKKFRSKNREPLTVKGKAERIEIIEIIPES